MQDRHSPQTRKSLLATHGGSIHWVKSGEDHQRGFAAHVRFAPKADKSRSVLACPLSAKSGSCIATKEELAVANPVRWCRGGRARQKQGSSQWIVNSWKK